MRNPAGLDYTHLLHALGRRMCSAVLPRTPLGCSVPAELGSSFFKYLLHVGVGFLLFLVGCWIFFFNLLGSHSWSLWCRSKSGESTNNMVLKDKGPQYRCFNSRCHNSINPLLWVLQGDVRAL